MLIGISPDQACAGLPAGLDDARDVSLERKFANFVATQPELSERSAWSAGQSATVSLTRRVSVSRQPLQPKSRTVAFFVGHFRVVRRGLELVVKLRILGDQLAALEFALNEGSFSHVQPQFLNGNLNAASKALASSSV